MALAAMPTPTHIRRYIGGAVVAGIAGTCQSSVAPASESDALTLFRQSCVETKGDAESIAGRLAEAGWRAAGPGELGPFDTLAGLSNLSIRGRAIDGSRFLLVTADAEAALDARPWRMCSVTASPADADANTAVASWLAVPSYPISAARPDDQLYVIVETEGTRRSAEGLTEAELQAAARPGRLWTVTVQNRKNATILLYGTPKN